MISHGETGPRCNSFITPAPDMVRIDMVRMAKTLQVFVSSTFRHLEENDAPSRYSTEHALELIRRIK
jgi:hypothetical protein